VPNLELACSPYGRLVPKVSNLSSRGTLRIGLARLMPQLPGFGALLISMAPDPQVRTEFGVLGALLFESGLAVNMAHGMVSMTFSFDIGHVSADKVKYAAKGESVWLNTDFSCSNYGLVDAH